MTKSEISLMMAKLVKHRPCSITKSFFISSFYAAYVTIINCKNDLSIVKESNENNM